MSVANDALNALFAQKLDTAEGKEKIAAYGSDWIRDRLREESFARKILPPRQVGRSELQVSVNHDTLIKIVETEPESRAMSMSFRGQPDVNYYTASRFEVPFHEVGSPRFEQTTQELAAYTIPITAIIKRHIVNDIQEVEDVTFLNHVESACQSLQEDANGLVFGEVYADDDAFSAFNVAQGTVKELGKVKGIDVIQQSAAANAEDGLDEDLIFPLQKDDIIKLGKLFPGRGGARNGRLRAEKLLITDTDLMDAAAWTTSDAGDKIPGETAVSGWKYKSLVGLTYIRTLKTDILRPGNLYAFCSPDYLGGFLILNKTQFYADKERNRVSFEAWEDIAIYLGNVAAVRKLELYAGAVELVDDVLHNPTPRADFLPFAEKDLGKLNNLVEENITFPAVSQF